MENKPVIKRQIIVLLAATGFIVASYGATAIVALPLLSRVKKQNGPTEDWERVRASSVFLAQTLIPFFSLFAICRLVLVLWFRQ